MAVFTGANLKGGSMEHKDFRNNLRHVLVCGLLSLCVFISGVALLGVLPIPVSLRGGLVTEMVTVTSGTRGGKVIVSTKPDGLPRIILYDAQGSGVLSLEATPGGASIVEFTSAEGDSLLRISTTGGRPSITVFDFETGKIAWDVVGDGENPVRVPGP